MAHFLGYALLMVAIVLEVIATSALQATEQFTRLLPTAVMAVCYLAAFYCLTHVLKVLPLGVTYALWSGVGIVLVSVVGFTVFKQKLDMAAVLGIALIVAGVVVINLFSKAAAH